jgi:hypothetical protein
MPGYPVAACLRSEQDHVFDRSGHGCPAYQDPGRAKVKNGSEGEPRRGEPSGPAMDEGRTRESIRIVQ